MAELGVPWHVPLVVLAALWFLVPAAERLNQGAGQAQCSPEVEHTEDQPDHNDVPGLVAQGPRGEKQFSNSVECRSNRDVFEHQQAMGQQEQCTGDTSHQDLPGTEQNPQDQMIRHLKAC